MEETKYPQIHKWGRIVEATAEAMSEYALITLGAFTIYMVVMNSMLLVNEITPLMQKQMTFYLYWYVVMAIEATIGFAYLWSKRNYCKEE